MRRVPAGSRLLVRTSSGVVHLRALEDLDLSDAWAVPVLAPVRALSDGEGTLEVATEQGLLTVDVHLVATDGRLELRAGRPTAPGPVLQQRRDDVRAAMDLAMRGAVLDALGVAPADADALIDATIEGRTVTVSGGGLFAELDEPLHLVAGARIYLELDLPGGGLLPCVVTTVESDGTHLRGRFVDIAPRDRERLIGLVFAQERKKAAGRLEVRGATTAPGRLPAR